MSTTKESIVIVSELLGLPLEVEVSFNYQRQQDEGNFLLAKEEFSDFVVTANYVDISELFYKRLAKDALIDAVRENWGEL